MTEYIENFRQKRDNRNNIIGYELVKMALESKKGNFFNFQIDSFKDVLKTDIPKTFSDYNIKNKFHSIKFEFPELLNDYYENIEGERVKVTPMIARRYELDYKGTLFVRLTVRNNTTESNDIIFQETLPFCQFPIVVGNFEDDLEEEDPLDPKGYFIFKGNEYFTELRDKQRNNIITNVKESDGSYMTRLISNIVRSPFSIEMEKIGKTSMTTIFINKKNMDLRIQIQSSNQAKYSDINILTFLKINFYIRTFLKLVEFELIESEISFLMELSILSMNKTDINYEDVFSKTLKDISGTDYLQWIAGKDEIIDNIKKNKKFYEIIDVIEIHKDIDNEILTFFKKNIQSRTGLIEIENFLHRTEVAFNKDSLEFGPNILKKEGEKDNFINLIWEFSNLDERKVEYNSYNIFNESYKLYEVYFLAHIRDEKRRLNKYFELVVNCCKINSFEKNKRILDPVDMDNYGNKQFQTIGM